MQTSEAHRLAQSCFDALLIEGKAPTVTEVTRSRLLLAAVVLDLDMGSEERVETHRSLRYESLYVHETPAQARTRLKRHFEQINRVSPFAAYLAVELVLAGQSPEFLGRYPADTADRFTRLGHVAQGGHADRKDRSRLVAQTVL
jgi:hypothetical protein